MATTNAQLVRRALDKARSVREGVGDDAPKLDAIIAVLNAENIDRAAGLTLPSEETPGLALARRVKVA